MTFFTIGVMSDFRKLWEEGIGKRAAVYVVCLFGFVISVGLVVSWVFFAGVKPPLAGRKGERSWNNPKSAKKCV